MAPVSRRRLRRLAQRRRRLTAAAVVVVAALVAGGTVVGLLHARPESRPGGLDPVGAWTAVCGFDGALVSAIAETEHAPPVPEPWAVPAGEPLGIAGAGDDVVVATRQGSFVTFTRWSADGAVSNEVAVAARDGVVWAAGDDGVLTAIARPAASGPRAERWDASGARLADVPLPGGPRIVSLTAIPGLQGAAALLVGREDGTLIAVRDDGTVVDGPVGPSLRVVPGLDDGLVAGIVDDDAAGTVALIARDLEDSTEVLRATWTPSDPDDGVWDATPVLTDPTAVVTGPAGEGFVVLEQRELTWIDARGIPRATRLDGQRGLSLVEGGGLARTPDGFRLLARAEDGDLGIIAFDDAGFADWLTAPTQLTAATERVLASLGVGIGPVAAAPFAHFDDGTAPAVAVRAVPGWGELAGSARPDLVLRWSVRGDPGLVDPVVQQPRETDVPWGGGEVPLTLPDARPGAYEVDVTLVDRATRTPVSGACLRYSVGAPGADLDLGTLPAGADWGGALPVRGVALADRLGIGSHRMQLDFGSLVPDPRARADPDALDWSVVPGAASSPVDDPFRELRRAAAAAERVGVDLVVQMAADGADERAAVEAGTWGGWVAAIAAGIEREAPGIRHWSAWNEPNNTFGDDGGRFTELVEKPFARAVHGAVPDAVVLGGNTLGFATEWWAQARDAGICDVVDAIAVHPYAVDGLGWEEAGFARSGAGFAGLRATLGDGCADLPVWDTESGWTADNAATSWAQAQNVARKRLWYGAEGVAGWTTFFSEGGFGEGGLSWSLVQYASHVKPGALASTVVDRMLEGRGDPVPFATGIPGSWAMRLPGEDTLVAAWSDGARPDVRLSTDAMRVEAIDEYGAVSTLDVVDGEARTQLTSAPQFFRVSGDASLRLRPAEPFGDDLLAGAPVTATSTGSGDPASITDPRADPFSPWRSGSTAAGALDTAPAVTVSLDRAVLADRVRVASAPAGCCGTTLRDYLVEVRGLDGRWHAVARRADQFDAGTVIVAFAAQEITGVRVRVPPTVVGTVAVPSANYTRYAGGLPTPGFGIGASDGVVGIASVSAWAPR